MALIQMPQYNEDLHYQELNNIIAELEAKLKATQSWQRPVQNVMLCLLRCRRQ